MSVSGKQLQAEVERLLLEGWLEKESRVLKSWRKRWFVLTPTYLLTFKEAQQYSSPTEAIPLRQITVVRKSDQTTHRQFSFKLETQEDIFYVAAESNSQREKWIGSIGAAIMKSRNKEES